jgi:hypothetical protein
MHALAFPIIDTDRMTPTSPDSGKMGARAWIVVALVLLAVVWQVVRLLIVR